MRSNHWKKHKNTNTQKWVTREWSFKYCKAEASEILFAKIRPKRCTYLLDLNQSSSEPWVEFSYWARQLFYSELSKSSFAFSPSLFSVASKSHFSCLPSLLSFQLTTLYLNCSFRPVLLQRDPTDRLFVQYWAFYNKIFLPKSIKSWPKEVQNFTKY